MLKIIEGLRLKCLIFYISFLFLISCAMVQVKTYEEALSKWKSYKDVANWMAWNFTYDMKRYEESLKIPPYMMPVRKPEETFKLKSGVCFDAARFVKETLDHIDPSYEAEIVFLDCRPPSGHTVCSFKKDGKLYVIDYGIPFKNLMGVHGPYNSIVEYKQFYELNHPRKPQCKSITFGWPPWRILK